MPSLDRLISATRKAVDERRAARPLAELEQVVAALPPIRPFTEAVVGEEISFVLQADAFHAGLLEQCRGRRDRRPLPTARAGGGRGRQRTAGAAGRRGRRPLPAVREPRCRRRRGRPDRRRVRRRGRGACPRCTRRPPTSGWTCVLEVGHEDEIERVLELLDPDSFLIQNLRDGDGGPDFEHTFSLLEEVPAGKVVVSRGRHPHRDEVRALESAGVDAAILGRWVHRHGIASTLDVLRGDPRLTPASRRRPTPRRRAPRGTNFSSATASAIGTATNSSPRSEAIMPQPPVTHEVGRLRPKRVASTRSCAVGEPPRWMWPSIVTRVSKPVRRSISRRERGADAAQAGVAERVDRRCDATRATRRSSNVSGVALATTTIEKSLPLAWRCSISSQQRSTVSGSSGIRITSAPPAMPAQTAIQPVWRPITSHDHHAVVRLGGGVQAVDRLGGDRHRRVEAEREVGAAEVVVDRLRARRPRARRARRAAGRPRPACPRRRWRPARRGRAGAPSTALDAALDVERVRPRGAAGSCRRGAGCPSTSARLERPDLALDHAPPAVQHADHLVAVVERTPRDRADHGVQPRAVAASREDADAHVGSVPPLLDGEPDSPEWGTPGRR